VPHAAFTIQTNVRAFGRTSVESSGRSEYWTLVLPDFRAVVGLGFLATDCPNGPASLLTEGRTVGRSSAPFFGRSGRLADKRPTACALLRQTIRRIEALSVLVFGRS
jgi:hypothetical protein